VVPPTASAWATYRRLLTYLKPERRWLWLALVGMVIDAAAHGAFTQLMKPLLDSFAPTQLVSPELKAQLPLLVAARRTLSPTTAYCASGASWCVIFARRCTKNTCACRRRFLMRARRVN
jgi:ABC-type multidrug transport system fused ATPase/permease subunit